jgi:hypothetical protein
MLVFPDGAAHAQHDSTEIFVTGLRLPEEVRIGPSASASAKVADCLWRLAKRRINVASSPGSFEREHIIGRRIKTMLKALLIGAAATATLVSPAVADAQSYYGSNNGYSYHRHHHRSHSGAAIAGALIGGVLGYALGSSQGHSYGYPSNSYGNYGYAPAYNYSYPTYGYNSTYPGYGSNYGSTYPSYGYNGGYAGREDDHDDD